MSIAKIVYDKNTTLREILISRASRVNEYYYLPYYFEIMADGKIVSHHIDNMPDNLKEFLLETRNNK